MMFYEYYAVERTGSSLQHYGVKGMKWGVRKAIQAGGERGKRKLSRQYAKAQKKLAKLNRKANIEIQKKEVQKHGRRAAEAFGLGAAGLGVYGAAKLRVNQLKSDALKDTAAHLAELTAKSGSRKKNIVGHAKAVKRVGEGLGTGPVGNTARAITRVATDPNAVQLSSALKKAPNSVFKRRMALLAAASAGALATGAYQTGRAMASKYRTTAKGHAKIVAKRDAWKKSMQEAFKGTQYDANHSSGNKNKKKRR